MPDAAVHLNWTAIAIAVLASFALGGVWFPLVVKRAYAIALGREMKSGALALVGPLLCSMVTTTTSAVLIHALGVTTYAGAVGFGLLVGLGYQTPMVVNIALNPLFPRPFLYSLINAPYFVAASVVASLILVAMR